MFRLYMSKSRCDHTVTWNSDYPAFQKQLVNETQVGTVLGTIKCHEIFPTYWLMLRGF